MSQVFGQRTPEVARLQLSIFLAATQDPALRDTATEALRSFEQLAVRVLSRLGVEKPRRTRGRRSSLSSPGRRSDGSATSTPTRRKPAS